MPTALHSISAYTQINNVHSQSVWFAPKLPKLSIKFPETANATESLSLFAAGKIYFISSSSCARAVAWRPTNLILVWRTATLARGVHTYGRLPMINKSERPLIWKADRTVPIQFCLTFATLVPPSKFEMSAYVFFGYCAGSGC